MTKMKIWNQFERTGFLKDDDDNGRVDKIIEAVTTCSGFQNDNSCDVQQDDEDDDIV